MEKVEKDVVIRNVDPQRLYEIVTNYPKYPSVFPDFTSVRVLEDNGKTKRVEFKAKIVMEVRYVLDIVHDDENLTTDWTFVEGEIVSDSQGGWKFEKAPDGTRVIYNGGIDVNAPLPKFVINKVSKAIVGKSIPNMFRDLEAAARRG